LNNNQKNFENIDLSSLPKMDKVGVEERVARFQTRSLKGESKMKGLHMILNMIDLTTLEGKDTPGKVKQMCYKALHLHDLSPNLPTVAAICVYPSMVKIAKKEVINSGVKIASVSTGFPSGQVPMTVKIQDTKFAIEEGADEIDMVISRGKFLSGEYQFVFDEIAAIKEICRDVQLKVILETGELLTLDNVRKASEIAMHAGADFIKTSTGKIQPAATMQVTYTMLLAIRDYFQKTGKMIGMKPAGGISTSKLALHNLVMVKETLGPAWLNNNYFRFGASSLANDVLMQIVKGQTGNYQSSDYFSMD
jgi:deoxyribose-phosphate aldolase